MEALGPLRNGCTFLVRWVLGQDRRRHLDELIWLRNSFHVVAALIKGSLKIRPPGGERSFPCASFCFARAVVAEKVCSACCCLTTRLGSDQGYRVV